MEELSFDKWYCEYGEELLIKFAENGADREMCFDLERALDEEYEKFLEQNK